MNGLEFSIDIEESIIEPGVRLVFGQGRSCMWRVLDYDEASHKALVIAEKSIKDMNYHERYESVVWENCTLRVYLNSVFLDTCFNEDERAAIIDTHNINPGQERYHTDGGGDTIDRIFILSFDEAEAYFEDIYDRACGDWWWLRSPGSYANKAQLVYSDGNIIYEGYIVNHDVGVRPAMYVDLSAPVFKTQIRENETGKLCIKQVRYITDHGEVNWVNPSHLHGTLVFPEAVSSIGPFAFRQCPELEGLMWDDPNFFIDVNAFVDCPKLKLPAEFYLKARIPNELFVPYTPDDVRIIANCILTNGVRSEYLKQSIKRLTRENASDVVDEYIAREAHVEKLFYPERLLRFALAVSQVVNKERIEQLYAILKKHQPKENWLAVLGSVIDDLQDKTGAGELYKQVFELSPAIFDTESALFEKLPNLLKILDGTLAYAQMYGTGWINLYDYDHGALKAYIKDKKTESTGKGMDHDALMKLLRDWQNRAGQEWYAPYAAYADEEELLALIDEMSTWRQTKDTQERIIRVRGAILLNDTNDAMRYADDYALLDHYAGLRGLTEDDVRDYYLSELGFDEAGIRIWQDEGVTYKLRLASDMAATVYPELPAKMPQSKAVCEIREVIKDIRPTIKNRKEKLFADFLSGAACDGARWRATYQVNPLLAFFAKMLVWEQEGTTFILNEAWQTVTVCGTPYEVSDAPVIIAHPMEMGTVLTKEWQEYFTKHYLKQPFDQIWEPVAEPELIKAGHYDGCRIPQKDLMHQEKHGITLRMESWLELKGCSAGMELIAYDEHGEDTIFEVTNFHFDTFTRQVNHIVVYLDRLTVADRIKKDDISVRQWLELFNMAQISEFIDLAVESGATAVSALLIRYKQEKFGDIDVLDEFTLDW